jgi:hypothetical protein
MVALQNRCSNRSRDKGAQMQLKAIAVLVIIGISILLFVGLRKDNRADAASGNCYAAAQGPSSPTVCE